MNFKFKYVVKINQKTTLTSHAETLEQITAATDYVVSDDDRKKLEAGKPVTMTNSGESITITPLKSE